MNREIKFRIWDSKNKIMNTNSLCYQLSLGSDGTIKPAIFENVLMQYTGLKDVNGIDIYEGDIVKVLSMNVNRIVFFHKCSFGIKVHKYLFSPIYESHDLLVVGNKYENTEFTQSSE